MHRFASLNIFRSVPRLILLRQRYLASTTIKVSVANQYQPKAKPNVNHVQLPVLTEREMSRLTRRLKLACSENTVQMFEGMFNGDRSTKFTIEAIRNLLDYLSTKYACSSEEFAIIADHLLEKGVGFFDKPFYPPTKKKLVSIIIEALRCRGDIVLLKKYYELIKKENLFNEDVLFSLLKAFAQTRMITDSDNLLGIMKENGWQMNASLYRAMFAGLFEANSNLALKFLQTLRAANTRLDISVYNYLLGRFVTRKKTEEAMVIYKYIKAEKMEDDEITCELMIRMYAESSLWDEAYAKLEYMKDNRIDRSVYSYIYLMRALLEANQVEKALELNEKMKQDRIPLNAEGYYYLINGLVKNNLVAKAYHFYISTRKNKIRISSEAFGVLIEAFGEKRDIYMVKQFHHHLTQANRHLNPELVSSLLIAYGNCKNKPCCDSLFKEKEVYLTSPLIVGAKMIADVQTKSYEDVIDMFEKLDEPVNAHLGFNAIESVLISYSKTKNHLKSLELYQRARKVEGQVLRVEAYESLLSCLVENNDEENLFKVIKEMSDSNIQLTCTSFNVLLQVYTNKGLAKEGYALYNRMIESGIKPDRKTYELLFPLYAKLYSSLEDILHLLKEMESNNVKPTTVILVELMKTCMAHGHWSTINNFWKNTVTEALGIKFSYNVAAICYIASSKMPKELPFYQEFRSTVTDKLLLAKRDEAEAVVDILGKNGEFHLIYQFLSIINSVYDTAFDLAIMYLKKGNEKALLVKLDQLYWKKKSSISKNDIK